MSKRQLLLLYDFDTAFCRERHFMKDYMNYNLEIKHTTNETVLFIKEVTTERAVEALKSLIKINMISPELYNVCEVHYDIEKGLDENTYPVVFIGEYPFLPQHLTPPVIKMSGVTAGYGGEGPHGTLEALELMGFNVDPYVRANILSHPKNMVVNYRVRK